MSAPPVLRPLRAILQRRLQIVPSRPTRTPYYLRASHHRSQLRYNASTPPDQPPKPDEPAREASSEQSTEIESPSTANPTEEGQISTTGSPAGNAEANVVTKFDIPGQGAVREAAIPRLDNTLVKSAFQKLKSTDAEIQAGIADAVARQLAADEATTVAVGDTPAGIEEDVSCAPVQESIVPETTTRTSSSAEAITTMTEPAEPSDLEPETPALEARPAVDANPKPVEAESDFVVELIPDTLSPEEEAIKAMTQEFEHLDKMAKNTDVEPELPSVPESRGTAAITDAPEQFDTLESAVAAERSIANQDEGSSRDMSINAMRDAELEKRDQEEHAEPLGKDEASSVDSSLDAALEKHDQEKHAEPLGKNNHSSVDSSLDTVRDEALEKRDREDHATQLSKPPEDDALLRETFGETGKEGLYEGPEPSRIPRNVAAYYLQPLRRVAEYGVPACDLQLRSYSIRPLESFCDFALRAAYYLGLPAYGPVPLPKIIERWTVPRSSFIFKKSQENFERITRRRLIQIKDANPETVQVWLAFLQKHQQAAVGMKANLWEFSSIDVAKQMDEAYKKAEPLMNDKYRLLQQNKEFESVEKVDEFLQATRYRVTGDQGQRKL